MPTNVFKFKFSSVFVLVCVWLPGTHYIDEAGLQLFEIHLSETPEYQG